MTYKKYINWKNTHVISEPDLSIIVPAYNEEIRIIPTIGAIASFISTLDISFELIVSDDGSTDDTVQLVDELDMVNLKVLRTGKNGGKGSAVQRGVFAASGKHILFCDADNSTPIEEFSKLMNKIKEEGYDIAVGSRAVDGAKKPKKARYGGC